MDSGFSVQNKETGGGEGGVIQNSEFRIQNSELRVMDSEFRIKSDGFRIQCTE